MRWPSKNPDDFLAKSQSDWRPVRIVPPPAAVDAAIGVLLVACAVVAGATHASAWFFLAAFVGLVSVRIGIGIRLARRMEPLEWIPPPRWIPPVTTVAILLVGDTLPERARWVWVTLALIPIGIWEHRVWRSARRYRRRQND